jgi:hypothetical protein
MNRYIAVAAAVLLAGISDCTCQAPPVPGGEICGAGTIDGVSHVLDPARSRFVIVVSRLSGDGPCGVFHSHVINAKAVLGEFSVVATDPAASTMKVSVSAAGLDPDDPDLRLELLPEGANFPLSQSDRQSIRGSVAEEVKADEFPTLVFTASGITSTTGAGTATMTADIAGATSEIETTYTVTKDGGAQIITGTATLIGTPHGMPRAALGFCIEPAMQIHFELAMVPGAVQCAGLVEGPAFQPTLFPDDACAEEVSYNEVRDVAVRRCAGCHASTLRLGATVPLVDLDHWRTDSIRNQGVPLYLTAQEFIHLDPADGLSMPPQPPDGEILTTDLTAGEIAIFDAWVADGARNVKCAADPGPTSLGPRIAPETTCSDEFNIGDEADGSAKNFIEFNCAYCHLDRTGTYVGIPQLSDVDDTGVPLIDPESGGEYALIDFDIGASSLFHPFYVDDQGERVSFWQGSLARIADLSMPPAVGIEGEPPFEGDPAFAAFVAWVNNGSPPPCP